MLWDILRLFKSVFQIIGLAVLYPILFAIMVLLESVPPIFLVLYMIFVLVVDIINIVGDGITNFVKSIFGIRKNIN